MRYKEAFGEYVRLADLSRSQVYANQARFVLGTWWASVGASVASTPQRSKEAYEMALNCFQQIPSGYTLGSEFEVDSLVASALADLRRAHQGRAR